MVTNVQGLCLPADTEHRSQCSSGPGGPWPSCEHMSCPSYRHRTWRHIKDESETAKIYLLIISKTAPFLKLKGLFFFSVFT